MVLPGVIEGFGADCGQVHQDNAADVPSQTDLKNALEKGSDEQKIETMVRNTPNMPRHAVRPPSDESTEEDPLHYAQRRCTSRPPNAHYTIRHALQVEAAQEADVPLPRGVSQT